jgi:Ni/Co efflux regulator RcnB
MRKTIIVGLMAATMLPAMASAQTHELRKDRQDIRQEQRDVNRSVRRGDSPREVRDQRNDVREARQEYRQDWRDYRQNHRDVYRQQRYVGPRGYAYRPVAVGYRFAPVYYARNYWISDPWRYRLPAAAGNRRWVRYGNDVVLVNIRTGRVIDVNRNFFW